MTTLKKTVRRRSAKTVYSAGKDRPIIVELQPGDMVVFRLGGLRTQYVVTLESLYMHAVRQSVSSDKPKRKVAIRRGIL